MEKLDVILPAGGRIAGEFAAEAGVRVKALISLGGRNCLLRAIEALRETGRVRRIVVVGPGEALDEAGAAGVEAALPEEASGPANILRGFTWLQEQDGELPERVMVAATDLPFMTAGAINRFLDACPPGADIAAPILTRQEYEARFPGTANVFVPLRGGPYGVGCVFLVNPKALLANRIHLERIFRARKSQWQMARLVGLQVLARWLTGTLTVSAVENRVSRILRCQGVAVPGCPAELAFDIDLPGEYEYAQSCFQDAATGRPGLAAALSVRRPEGA